MARIRTIKPDAFKSDTLAGVSFFARWLFAGLLTYCDDEGRGRGDVRLVTAELFALDDIVTPSSVEQGIRELARIGTVCLYQVDGREYLHFPKWTHQRVSHPTESKLPDCPKHSGTFPEGSGGIPEGTRGQNGKPAGQSPPENFVRTLEIYSEEQGTGNREQGGGSDFIARPRRPSAKCQKHANDDNPPNCGQCATARKAAEAWQPPTLSAKSFTCPEHPDQPAGRCPKCKAAAVPRPKKAS